MGSHRAAPAHVSRRSLREGAPRETPSAVPHLSAASAAEHLSAAPAAHGGARSRRGVRAFGRSGVLLALVAATVVVPVAQQAIASGGVAQLVDGGQLPSTVSALSALSSGGKVPSSLQAAGPVVDRDVATASRSMDTSQVLPGCSGQAPTVLAANGKLPESDLCTLWDGTTQVRADFAVALAQMNEAFVAQFGTDLCFTSGYRSLAEQYAVKAEKGYLAATPGKSNHGLGLAVDFCTDQTSGAKWAWLNRYGPTFGIANPEWAKTSKYEPWHWEFTAAVNADNSYTGATAGDGS